jgi:hypothetical protein
MAPLRSGIDACRCSWVAPVDNPGRPSTWPIQGFPNPMLNAHNTQTTSTSENALKAMSIVLTPHFFCTRPPYNTAMPGKLIKPTRVAAVSCQALSPAFNHCG